MKKGENFYRRDPSKALSGMIGLSLEERGVYNTVLDLLYSTWRPLEDDRPFLANWCGCAVQKLNPIVRRLIEKGRLVTFTEGGRTYLSDEHFEAERAKVKGASDTRSGRANVGEKSGEVGEKSEGVGQNTGLLDAETAQNQCDAALDKSREEKKDPPTPQGGRRKPRTTIPEGFPTEDLIVTMQDEARQAGANVDMRRFATYFRDQCQAKDHRYADWPAAWRNWCRGDIAKAPKTAIAALTARTAPPSPADRWDGVVREFRANGYWNRDDNGPPPGREGCRAPPSILALYGYATATTPANDRLIANGAVA